MYKLIYKDGDQLASFPVERQEVSIGRASDNDLIINDFGVSRHHAKIVLDHGECFVVDLNSRNGTRLNNGMVSRADLKDGDEISLGKFVIRFTKTSDDRVELEEETDGHLLSPGTFIKPISDIRKIIPESAIEVTDIKEKVGITDIQKSNQILAILIEVAKSLLTVKPLDEVLNLVMNLIFEHLPAERGFLMLYDEHTNDLIPKVVKYSNEAQAGSGKITISKTITNKVFQDKVSILTSDAQIDPRFDGGASIIFHNIRSAMCAPLWNKEDVIGVVFVDSSTRIGSFTPSDLDLLTALANYAAIGIEQARLNEKIKEEIKRRSQLERYHSPAVINRIINAAAGEMADAQEMEVSVMFSDIVGFTPLSEKMEPQRVALLLNEYFAEMTDVIFKYDGTLDKFIGDAIMAVFGAPLPMEDHALRAVRTALEMREKLEFVNREKLGTNRINVRIGINSGHCVAGDIGSPKRKEYTVLGNTVNVAQRLEAGAAKPGQIVVGENTFNMIREHFEFVDLGDFNLKGLEKPIKVYEVLSERKP